MDPFLPRVVVERITARKRPSAMRKKLDEMRIAYIVDGDGYPLVPCGEMPQVRYHAKPQPTFDHLRKRA